MSHPLEDTLRAADGFLLIGESSKGRFPAYSYQAYTEAGKRFYCLDLDGLGESRGKVKGGKVYASVEELPAEHDDLALIWVTPHSAARAVELAHQAGCTRVWFSFGTGHKDAVAKAGQLGMAVVEIGRCPLLYLDKAPAACKGHRALTRLTGTLGRAPQTDPDVPRREMW